MRETRIYIGLNDKDTLHQKFETARYISILQQVCRSYHAAFSFQLAEGGYFHENGEYTQEKTLVLSLMDTDPALADEIAKDLCVFFNQESVLVTESAAEVRYISEKL